MAFPLISILVPVYNCEAYLDECITSIINQDYENLQIVLANDGSTDKSLEICQKYAAKDPRITVLTGPNKGVSTTRNILLDQIKGDYFLFVDADDWIEPDMVGYLVNLIQEYKADIAVCANVTSNSNSTNHEWRTTIKRWNQKETIEKFLYHKEINGSLCNKLINSGLIGKNRFEPDVFYGEDAFFCWGLLQNITSIIISDKQLYHYRPNPRSASHSNWNPYRKGTGHKVWEKISAETSILWPEFEEIAKARFALEEMWALYFAASANYPCDEHIYIRQKSIKENKSALRHYQIDGKEKYFTALILAYCYPAGKFIHWVSKKVLGRGI